MRRFIIGSLWCFFSVAIIAAQTNCSQLVTEALELTAEVCSDLGRNEACYGNLMVDASLRSEDLSFSATGDIINLAQLDTLTLSPFDGDAGTWGISVFNAQANLPNTLPGQLIRMILFGNVSIENAVPFYEAIEVTANGNTRLRSTPSSETDFNIMGAINAGQAMSADGRTESGEWLHVSLDWGTGWVAALVVDGDSERMSLPIVAVGEPAYNQMQAFYLTTGIGQANCEEVPQDGVLLQTPDGVEAIDFLINGVQVRVGSTVYLQTVEQNLRVYLLEGKTSISANSVRQFMPAGTFVDVPLSDDGREAIGAPTFPQGYDPIVLANLPLDFPSSSDSSEPIISPVEAAEPVAEGEVETAILDTYSSNPYGLVDGWYRISVISFEQVAPNPFTNGYCASGGTALQYVHTEGSQGWDWGSIERESISSFTFTGDNSASDLGGCIVEHRAVWTANGPN